MTIPAVSWILLVFGFAKDQPVTDEPVRVFVIGGQSNGEGKGSIKMHLSTLGR
jgi:hypothetical protein